jgi:hypothetical protein
MTVGCAVVYLCILAVRQLSQLVINLPIMFNFDILLCDWRFTLYMQPNGVISNNVWLYYLISSYINPHCYGQLHELIYVFTYFWTIVFLGKCTSEKTSYSQISFWANAFLGNCLMGKCHLDKFPSGQMSLWAYVVSANVTMEKQIFLQMSIKRQMSCQTCILLN